MNALAKAFRDTDTAYLVAKSASPAVLTGPTGLFQTPATLSRAVEQYSHNRNWVYVAVRAIATRCAAQDLFIGTTPKLRRKGLGSACEPMDHPFLDAFNDPNPLFSRWALVYSATSSLALTGRAYLWLAETPNGLQIWPLPSHWIEPADPMRGSWLLRPDGGMEAKELDANEICCFTMPDPGNPFGAISPLQSQATAVATDEKLQNAQFRSFVNGVNPSVAIRVGQSGGERPMLSPEQRRELIHGIKRHYAGSANHGEPLILDGLIESIDRVSMAPSEMDFLASGEQVKARILQAFGVNPAIVGQLEGANRASAVVAEQSFAQNTINPTLELLGQTLSAFVSRRFGQRLVCWFDPCRADDRELRLQEWRAARASGDVSRNEFRRHVLNLGDVTNGDDYL